MALPYPSWSVVFGSTPTAAFWSELGANDDALAAGTGFNTNVLGQSIFHNPYKFSVTTTGSVNVTTTTNTKVPFNSKIFDTGSNFDAVTNFQFTAPIAGFYQFNANIPLYGIGGTSILTLYKNGVGFRQLNRTGNSASGTGTGSALLQLAVNDTVYVNVFQNGGTTASIDGGACFDGFLVSRD